VWVGARSVIQSRGILPVSGLYFVARSWQWTRGSALLLGIGEHNPATLVVGRASGSGG
jgi:hypothetical protein